MYVCMYVCMYVSMYVCMYVFMCVCVCVVSTCSQCIPLTFNTIPNPSLICYETTYPKNS